MLRSRLLQALNESLAGEVVLEEIALR